MYLRVVPDTAHAPQPEHKNMGTASVRVTIARATTAAATSLATHMLFYSFSGLFASEKESCAKFCTVQEPRGNRWEVRA